MFQLVEECRQSYELSLKTPVTLSPAEQGLVALKLPKKKIDADWLIKTEELISGRSDGGLFLNSVVMILAHYSDPMP